MAEWSKAPVLKTGEVHASVGSNPTPSAIFPCPSPNKDPLISGTETDTETGTGQ